MSDDFSIHEVLHMASFLAGAVDEDLCEHHAIKSDPVLSALASKAVEALGDLYQAIGQVKWGEERQDHRPTSFFVSRQDKPEDPKQHPFY